MTEFATHLLDRFRQASEASAAALADGDEFTATVFQSEAENLSRLALVHGVALPASP